MSRGGPPAGPQAPPRPMTSNRPADRAPADPSEAAGGVAGAGVCPPAIDPRIEQRRQEVHQAEARRRLRLLLGATAVAVAGLAGWGVLRSPELAVRHVRVIGERHTPAIDVARAAGLTRHRQMADLAPQAMARAIEALPWIDTAHVARHWPRTVVITVTERQPVAVAADRQGGWALVDARGRVLAVQPAPLAGLPAVTAPAASGAGGGPPATGAPSAHAGPAASAGPTASAGPNAGQPPPPPPPPSAPPAPPPAPPPALAGSAGTTVPAELDTALAVAAALGAPLLSQVQAVLAGNDGQVQLAVAGGATVLLGTPEDLSDKLTALRTMLARVNLHRDTLDVRVPAAPVLTAP